MPFPPDHKTVDEFPLFLKSRAEFERLNPDWEYKLWTQDELDELVGNTPWLFDFYNQVRYPVTQVDIAKVRAGQLLWWSCSGLGRSSAEAALTHRGGEFAVLRHMFETEHRRERLLLRALGWTSEYFGGV